MCTAKGSDVRPGVPPVSLGLRCFCVAGVGQCALPRGRMYALASLRCPLGSAAFAWQAWDNVECQGVGCTPWRPSAIPWAPLLLRGRRGTMCTAKGLLPSSYSSSRPPTHSHTSLTHHTHTHTHTHSHIITLTHSHSIHSHTPHTLTHTHTHAHTHTPTRTHTHTLTLTHTLSECVSV